MSLQSSTLQQTRLVYPSIHWSGSILSLQLSQISKDVSLITIKVAKSLNAAIKNFCPSCLDMLERSLSQEEQVSTILQHIIKEGAA
jgi:hypothetical protein